MESERKTEREGGRREIMTEGGYENKHGGKGVSGREVGRER